jgi:hypothetical protein
VRIDYSKIYYRLTMPSHQVFWERSPKSTG